MKILAVADRRVLESLPEMITNHSVDAVFLLGDLKFIDICDLVDVSVPIIGVYGNHCMSDYFPKLNAMNAHLKLNRIKGYSVFGFEGCPYYKGEAHEFTQTKARDLLKDSPRSDILIAHSPASGMNSSSEAPHQGFEALKEYLEEHSPRFFFHGHSYPNENQKVSKFNNTIIYWVSGAEIIDLNKLSLSGLPDAAPY